MMMAAVLASSSLCGCAQKAAAADDSAHGSGVVTLAASAAAVMTGKLLADIEEVAFDAQYPVRFAHEETGAKVRMRGNRAYVSIREIAPMLKGTFTLNKDDLSFPLLKDKEGVYVSLSDVAKLCGIYAVFRSDLEEVELFRLTTDFPKIEKGQGKKVAYFRMEDIMADPSLDGRFTHAYLERIRLEGLFLSENTDGFYVGWIPKFVDPVKGISVDVSRDFSFHAADFVYTLDILQNCGGKLLLHGYTHQYANEVSADGSEFAPKCGLTREQAAERMDEALRICSDMGYETDIFEFPHYESTGPARREAEARFSVIYEQDPEAKSRGLIASRKVNGRMVYYVPTPADHVHSEYDAKGILRRIEAAEGTRVIQSLFFHPVIDYGRTIIREDGRERIYRLDEDRNITYMILKKWDELGYRAGPFDFL